jgi:CRP-like cAMP-binding protein
MPISLAQLRNIPLLADLSDEVLGRLAGLMSVRHFQRRGFVFINGQQGDDLLFLLEGRLQVVNVTEDGRDVGIHFISPGDYFGELSVIDGLPRSASVVAVSPAQVAFLPRQHARTLIFRNPLVAERMLTHLALTVRLSSSRRMLLSIPNAFQRVYTQLLQFSRKDNSGTLVIEDMPTHQEIAIMVNTSRETVSRAINALFELSAMEKRSHHLVVLKPDILKKAAEEGLG